MVTQPGMDDVLALQWSVRTRTYRGRLYLATRDATYECDDPAQFILRRLDGRATLGAIAGELAATYRIAIDDAEADVGDLAGQLLELEIVHRPPPPRP